jgi:Asp-tRNA(Asn)/Glu-tRNA(Gln) amidotransferase A subunit family amidase
MSNDLSVTELEDIIDAEVIEDITEPTALTPRQQQLSELRRLVDMLERHPEVPLPHNFGKGPYDPIGWFAKDVTEAAAISRAVGGPWKKNDPNDGDWDANNLQLTRILDRELHVRIIVSREKVCEKKVIGTEKKKVKKLVTEAVYEEVYEDADVVEFECKSLLSVAAQIELDRLAS